MVIVYIHNKLLISLLVLTGLLLCETTLAENYLERKTVQQFIQKMVTEHNFDEAELTAIIAGVVYKQSIIDAISRPAEKVMTWKDYRKIFLTDKRIESGRDFIQVHQQTFQRAEKEYGVPTSILAAVIGVETFYGQRMGRYRVIDSLFTLAFDYPRRASFFQQQLEEFLLLARDEQQNESELLGSYAGAMGFGQFIPSSYRAYAVDFDADGVRDIWNNPVDAIGSVANYLGKHGWRSEEIITTQVSLQSKSTAQQASVQQEVGLVELMESDSSAANSSASNSPQSNPSQGKKPRDLFGTKLKPHLDISELREFGLQVDESVKGAQQVSPLLFNGKDGEEYWLAFYNFYVITRYNHSKLYAMAVYQLSQELM